MKIVKILLGLATLIVVAVVLFWPQFNGWFKNSKLLITAKGVGPIKLGQPLPAKYLNNKSMLQDQYVYGFYADGQPYEGFNLTKPPLLVAIENGPFLKWDEAHKVFKEPSIEKLKEELFEMQTKNVKVKFLMIETPFLRTEKGIGVGSTMQEIKEVYSKVHENAVPPSFGGDEYAVMPVELDQVVFYFKDQQSAKIGGKVQRMMIFE